MTERCSLCGAILKARQHGPGYVCPRCGTKYRVIEGDSYLELPDYAQDQDTDGSSTS